MNDKIPAAAKRLSWSGGWASLRDLEVIQAVIDSRSVTQAAERLGISQPAVSRVLNQIEERSGRQLFHRENNRLVPSMDALLLYEEIEIIADSFSRLSQFRQRDARRQLRILVPPTLAYDFVNPLTARFMRENPHTQIRLEIGRSEHILQALARDEADVAIADIFAEQYHANLSQIPLRKTQIICVLPKGHPLCEKAEISSQDLHQQDYIALVKNNVGRSLLDQALESGTSRPNIVAEVSDLKTVFTFVEQGLGVSLVSAFPLNDIPGLEYRLFMPRVQSLVACFTRKNNDALVQAYSAFIRKNQPPANRYSSPV